MVTLGVAGTVAVKSQRSEIPTTRTRSHPEMVGDMSRVTLNYQKFLLCISSRGQKLYSHQKLNMCIYWFSSESGYRRRRPPRRTPRYNHYGDISPTRRTLRTTHIEPHTLHEAAINKTGFCHDTLYIFTRDSIYAIARICHGNSVCPSVCHTGGSVKNG